MLLKLTPLIPEASGKIGGHSISSTRNGIMMKTIVQPRKRATNKQSAQRSITADITNKWQFLTPTQKASFNAAAPNYSYLDNLGNLKTRNGFQTFCFLNQNRRILSGSLLKTAPIFTPIVKPTISIISTTHDALIINGSNLEANYIYVVYAMVHYSFGASTFEQTPLDIAHLTKTQLENDVDLTPYIRATYAAQLRPFRVTFQVVAIDTVSGNRDLAPVTLTASIQGATALYDVLSYYPFDTDANDYFGINNGVPFGMVFGPGGYISGMATFAGLLTSYINLGNGPTLQFSTVSEAFPFSVIFWVKTNIANNYTLFLKGNRSISPTLTAYACSPSFGTVRAQVNDTNDSNRVETRHPTMPPLDTWTNICVTYNGKGKLLTYINGVTLGPVFTTGSFVHLTPNGFDLLLGIGGSIFPAPFNGNISELAILNQHLSVEEINHIIAQNMAGIKIIDIY